MGLRLSPTARTQKRDRFPYLSHVQERVAYPKIILLQQRTQMKTSSFLRPVPPAPPSSSPARPTRSNRRTRSYFACRRRRSMRLRPHLRQARATAWGSVGTAAARPTSGPPPSRRARVGERRPWASPSSSAPRRPWKHVAVVVGSTPGPTTTGAEDCVVWERRRILPPASARTQNASSVCIRRWRLFFVPKKTVRDPK
jgi:hypothetical protein